MFNLITSVEDLEFLSKELSASEAIAVDTEFRRTSKEHIELSLIQINDSQETYIVDCLVIKDTSSISTVFEDDRTIKVLHSCKEDIEAINSWTEGGINNIYDTQLANAFLGHELSISYQAIVKEEFGITLKKEETRSNWIRRPLRESQLNYAAMDVEYLLEIYESQVEKLKLDGKDQWLKEETDLITKNLLKGIDTINEDENNLIPISKSEVTLVLSKFNKIIDRAAESNFINKTLLFSKKSQKDFLKEYFAIGLEAAMSTKGKWRRILIYDEMYEMLSSLSF